MYKQAMHGLAAILVFSVVLVSGCVNMQGPDPEPVQEPEPSVSQQKDREADEKQKRTQSEVEKEDSSAESGEQEEPAAPPLPWERDRDFSDTGTVESLDDVNIALTTLYRMSSLAFMGPVIEHVESVMGLRLGSDLSASTHECPAGGSFRREWDEESRHEGKPRTVRYEFDECEGRFREGRLVRLNGAYSRSFEPVAEKDHVRLDIDVTGWLIDDDGKETPIRLHGTQQNERPSEGGIIRETPTLELFVGDAYTALVDFREAVTVVESSNPDEDFPAFSSSFETEYAGRLVSSRLGGTVEVSTPVKLMEQQPACAASGVYRFEGDSVADVRYGPDTGTMDRLVVEIDHSRLDGFDSCDAFIRAMGFERPRVRPF